MSDCHPTDWRLALLQDAVPLPVVAAGRNPGGLVGYTPRAAVRAWRLAGDRAVAATWDFSVHGGSFGEDDATVLAAAAAEAGRRGIPLVTVVRSGGTRLQEGMAALVGIPRARLALLDLAAAGLPHLCVADHPTTGGVWISVAAAADLRIAVTGATVAFAGPRVVEAVTGSLPPAGASTAASALAAGLVDAVVPADGVTAWVAGALLALTASPQQAPPRPEPPALTAGNGWEQVRRARARLTGGADLLAALLADRIPLAAPRGDTTVAACVGRAWGRPVVGVALAAAVGVAPTPDGYRLATRAVHLAGRLGLPLLTLVDTPGADPTAPAEQDGVAPAMGEALDAVLTCPSPTLALVHGEGGSGGALALAACDRVLVTPDAYFAAIGPEGASAALRRPVAECAELLRLTPADLLALGAADGAVAAPADALHHLVELAGLDADERRARRRERWAAPLPGRTGRTGPITF